MSTEATGTQKLSFDEFKLYYESTAVEIGHRKIIALKSSSSEYFIPKAFRILFILVGVAALLAVAFNWSSFVFSWKSMLQA